MTNKSKRMADYGFTLTELAVVMVIVALLIGGLLLPLAAQEDLRKVHATESTLYEVRDALLGFAAANGRLPCPALDNGTGKESVINISSGVCQLTQPVDIVPVGYVPAVTLGLSPLDPRNRLIDAWGNPIRYAVSNNNSYEFTKPMTGVSIGTFSPNLVVCPSGVSGSNTIQAAGTLAAACPSGINANTDSAVVVLYSLGPNGSTGGTSVEEQHNPNIVPSTHPSFVPADRVFVSHPPAPKGAANGEFDDIVIWLSPNILYSRMIAAGRLP